MVRRALLYKFTNVLRERALYIFEVEGWEATRSCQTLITSYRTTRCLMPEDCNLDVLRNCVQMCTETVVTRRRSNGYR